MSLLYKNKILITFFSSLGKFFLIHEKKQIIANISEGNFLYRVWQID